MLSSSCIILYSLTYLVTNIASTRRAYPVRLNQPRLSKKSSHFPVSIVANTSLFVADTASFVLTLFKTLSAVLEGRRLRMSPGLTYYLLRDGTYVDTDTLPSADIL